MIRLALFTALLAASVPAAAADPATILARGLQTYAAGDYGAARRNFTMLAAQGSAVAETMLGAMFAHGEGGPVDAATAVSYWYRAANRGYAPAQLALAQALAAGRGVERNPRDAWLWAQLATRYGDAAVVASARELSGKLQPSLTAGETAELHKRLEGWRPWALATP